MAVTDVDDQKPSISAIEAADGGDGHHASGSMSLKGEALAQSAAKAITQEQTMSLREGLKIYPKAVGWSVIISTAIVMEGFDTLLLQNLFANLAFQTKFGRPLANGSYDLTATWQTALTVAPLAGGILGLVANGIIADRFGCRKTIIGSLILTIAFVFITFFAKTAGQLLAGELLLGFPWGVFQTITIVYASEVCPVVLRPYLTTYVNLCWVFGQLIASGVLKGVAGRVDQWSYRIPFGLQWIWPIPIMIGVYLAPESPWWLVRRGEYEKAKASLRRLASTRDTSFDPDATIAMMEHTDMMEKALSEGTSYIDCFRGVNLRRTEIAICAWLAQVLTGAALSGYSTYFYLQAGLPRQHAFTLTLVQYAIGAVGTGCSWALMSRFGRRTLYLWGIGGLWLLLLAVGLVAVCAPNPSTNTAAGWATGSLLIAWTALYDATVGPVCYSLVSELPSTRLRAKTVVIARASYNAGFIVVVILTPRMLNPTAWNWGGKAAFFWAGFALLCFVWTFFRLPEPKGRTYGELDILFARGTPARKFARTVIEPVDEGNTILEKREEPVVETVEKPL